MLLTCPLYAPLRLNFPDLFAEPHPPHRFLRQKPCRLAAFAAACSTSLFQCTVDASWTVGDSHLTAACSNDVTGPTFWPGTARLGAGGGVELRISNNNNNEWWPLCSDNLGPTAAALVCSTAGFPGTTPTIEAPIPLTDGSSNTIFLNSDDSCEARPNVQACSINPTTASACVGQAVLSCT
ncbi:hypothetical protein CHLNCDRAFT_140149 [Chlorella variabilis]|uniref:SRCR domain-containing protein n=1 Tax=Chlorella variabilis TaxID=554065 RepID=E1ZRM4_CHLVA|nr:hypothetical protein CHLNCDRAFT_140149 [Chlorella variabilis]EFN51436.1 hypothetical protein CHLNCDRAFT_140149 [Chlorella variabilis]|eukprot:XP_005843538.1 hypothetical protein CHLNCDRAFT_140149 [Chlorella variabilis]